MSDIFFVIRMSVITFGVVLFMQVQVNERTIEEHSLAWLRSSSLISELQEVADGAISAGKSLVATVGRHFNKDFFKGWDRDNQAGFRHLRMGIDRSKTYIGEKAKEAQEKLKEAKEKASKKLED